jgi:hypothetical protein
VPRQRDTDTKCDLRSLLYSMLEEEKGTECGTVQTLFLKVSFQSFLAIKTRTIVSWLKIIKISTVFN